MKQFFRILPGVILLACGTGTISRNTISEKEVLAAEEARRTAVMDRDVRRLDLLIAPEYTVITIAGALANKADELRLYSSGATAPEHLVLSDISVRVYGRTAVVTGLAHRRDVLHGAHRDFKFRYTHVWVWRANRLQVVSRHATELRDKRSAG